MMIVQIKKSGKFYPDLWIFAVFKCTKGSLKMQTKNRPTIQSAGR
ncbi:hypothetical protein [Wielerella bovis]|nr:hypothetical protein [Wielerella bovis]